MTETVKRALAFAREAHRDQKRKYTNHDFIVHPFCVYERLKNYSDDEGALVAALLHDTVEDTSVTLEQIREEFGLKVERYVYFLTNAPLSAGNRKVRKEIDRERLSKAPSAVQDIKYCDILDNTTSIYHNDPNFFRVYRDEVVALLKVMNRGTTNLYIRTCDRIISLSGDDTPYLPKLHMSLTDSYNPNFGDNKLCNRCGHTYDRHFDSDVNRTPIGCKHCPCMRFQ